MFLFYQNKTSRLSSLDWKTDHPKETMLSRIEVNVLFPAATQSTLTTVQNVILK